MNYSGYKNNSGTRDSQSGTECEQGSRAVEAVSEGKESKGLTLHPLRVSINVPFPNCCAVLAADVLPAAG